MLQSILKVFKSTGTVSRRIRSRRRLFWSDPRAEDIRNMVMSASDPFEKWKDVPYWQRKLSNKYNAREFAKKLNCQVAELYWKGRDIEALDFDRFPGQYVIRPTTGHSCNMVFLMNEGINLLDGRAYTPRDLKHLLRSEVAANSRQEFLVEEFLRNEEGKHVIPTDYKFLMFNGEIASIVVINREAAHKGSQIFYDENWDVMENLTTIYPTSRQQEPPACFPELTEMARRLSRAYGIFVRIDLYATDRGAVFGEFTPTPSRGYGFTSYGEEILGYYWDRYCPGLI